MVNYHVSRNKDSGLWEVKRDGADRVSSQAETQKEAEEIAKKLCKNLGGGEVRIHGKDGKIRDSETVVSDI